MKGTCKVIQGFCHLNQFLHHYNVWSLLLLLCRSHAIACVNQFIIGRAQALMDNIDTFIEVSLCVLQYQAAVLVLCLLHTPFFSFVRACLRWQQMRTLRSGRMCAEPWSCYWRSASTASSPTCTASSRWVLGQPHNQLWSTQVEVKGHVCLIFV